MCDRPITATECRRRTFGLRVLAIASGALVAFGASAAADGINPKNGSYAGTTNQGKPVSFKVSNGRVKNAKFTVYSAPCTSTFYFPGASATINNKGKFSMSTSIATLSGKFVNRHKVNGKATGEFQSCPGGTVTVSYTATRQ